MERSGIIKNNKSKIQYMELTELILKELPYAITVCDENAIIIFMNDKSIATFQRGEESLIGKSLLNCHNPNSIEKIKKLLATGEINSYTIEKEGIKKLIYQSPWYKEGKIAGLIEISLIIPVDMPHYIRG
jgi:DUF438 domain-containing protein